MTQQRLAELLAEFRWSLFNLNGYLHAVASRDAADANTRLQDPDWWANLAPVHINRYCGTEIQREARRYIIARDFNEFDPGKADMLWKLRFGGL